MDLFRSKYSLQRVIVFVSSYNSSFDVFSFIIIVIYYCPQIFETPNSSVSWSLFANISLLVFAIDFVFFDNDVDPYIFYSVFRFQQIFVVEYYYSSKLVK